MEASAREGARDVQRRWPGRPEGDRAAFCQAWGLPLCPLTHVADEFLLRGHRLRGFAADAGAGGDCFFLSVAASLQALRAHHELPAPLEALFSGGASRAGVAERLRGVVGAAVLEWRPAQFLDFATTCLAEEVAGTWLDRWRMSAQIAGTPYSFMRGVNAVMAVSVDRAQNLTLECKHGDSPGITRHKVRHGVKALSAMQRAVADQLSQAGDSHWATSLDISILAAEFKICFCILGNQATSMSRRATQAPADVLHSYTATVTDAQVYVCLYNISFQHFQLIFFDLESGFQSSFLPTEMPASLLNALSNA